MKINVSAVGYDEPAERDDSNVCQRTSGTYLVGVFEYVVEGVSDTLPPTPDEAPTLPDLTQSLDTSSSPPDSEDVDWDWNGIPR